LFISFSLGYLLRFWVSVSTPSDNYDILDLIGNIKDSWK